MIIKRTNCFKCSFVCGCKSNLLNWDIRWESTHSAFPVVITALVSCLAIFMCCFYLFTYFCCFFEFVFEYENKLILSCWFSCYLHLCTSELAEFDARFLHWHQQKPFHSCLRWKWLLSKPLQKGFLWSHALESVSLPALNGPFSLIPVEKLIFKLNFIKEIPFQTQLEILFLLILPFGKWEESTCWLQFSIHQTTLLPGQILLRHSLFPS